MFCVPEVELCNLNTFVTVGITCIVDGLRGFAEALASGGTSFSEACLELIDVGPFVCFPQKVSQTLSCPTMTQCCGSWPIGFLSR